MATASNTAGGITARDASDQSGAITSAGVLAALGSLKLTVALFAASLIIVLVGTLAQDEMNMQDVKERYFTSWIAMMHVDDFFPQAFLPHDNPIRGIIPFPGGALIGILLMVNLIASKSTRFHVSAKGGRFTAGIAFVVSGFAVAGLIIASGHSSNGLQGAPPISYEALWKFVQGLGIIGAIGLIAVSVNAKAFSLKITGLLAACVLGGVVAYTFMTGMRIDDPGLRIVWQLAKGMGAGLILLVGCLLLFGRQGGNLLLHLGVGLLMFGQFAFGDRQLEQRISLLEGDSTNAMVNLDEIELTFVQKGETEDVVTAIPGSRLAAAAASGDLIRDDALPVDVKVLEYFENSKLTKPPNSSSLATTGIGLQWQAVNARKKGGTESEVNTAAAYIELRDKESGEPQGVHLVSQILSDQKMLFPGEAVEDEYDSISVGGSDFQLGLKYHREVKPYWVHLEDVQRRNYSGTDTPRDYSSYIRIIDPETGEDRRERVWMNNPLRYRGETFFQSNYTALPGGKELTGLQVVRNSGWLIPYVSCSIMALGMLAHFMGTLRRFVGRRERETAKEIAALSVEDQARLRSPKAAWMAVLAAGTLAVMMLVPWSAAMKSMRPETRNESYDFYAMGKIPTQFGGRMMPLDAFARQTLKAVSNKEALPLENAPGAIKERAKGQKSLTAIQWLMEVAIDESELRYLPMFRVDAEEVRSQLKLERRKSKLYSLDELLAEWPNANPLIVAARDKEVEDQSFKERKLLELDRRTRQYMLTAEAFQLPQPPRMPEGGLPEGVSEEMFRNFAISELRNRMRSLARMPAARIVPPTAEQVEANAGDPDWSAYASAFFDDAARMVSLEDETTARTDPFSDMIESYSADKKDFEGFNEAVDAQLALSSSAAIPGFVPQKVSLERWMQSNSPRVRATIFYIITMVLGLIYFATGGHRLRLATWGILLVAMLIHTVAIASRIYITGRAPVINIYSSAVFIGWAAVIFGLVVEKVFKLGFGNMLAATAGTLSLLVANGLSDGDTMPVLQAVLDTQFWLSTHVISVSLGYVATMVAGTLGVGYLLANWFGAEQKAGRSLYRMIYGAACFGILFSTIGTILGGLWADDSWGRFWGWDPKENGALLIVIWNALMLHARWDGMVKARGFALLAIGGNIVTAWSWFGTNELGIGLHSYGFTQGVLMWLTIYIVSQVFFIFAGSLLWRKSTPAA